MKNFSVGDIEIGRLKLPKLTAIGLSAVLIAYIAATGMYATSLGWWGNGDTVMHVDYIWQVSQGALPVFSEAIQYAPYNERLLHEVQSAAHHPPLYYLLLGPFMSELLEMGEWQKAVAIGRVVNIFIGMLTVLALAWAGWLFGGSRKALFATLVPFIAVFHPAFIKASGDVNPDALLVLLTILTFIFAYKTLKNGLTTTNFVALLVLSVLGMLTKIAFLPALMVALGALVISPLIRKNKFNFDVRSVSKGLVAAGIVGVAVVAMTGWFYYGHNYEASGSFTRAGSQEWISDRRDYKTLDEVLTSRYLVLAMMPISVTAVHPYWIFLLALVSLTALTWWLLTKGRWKVFINQKHVTFIVLFLVLHFMVLFLGQISHAVGYGQLSARYFLPGTLLSSLVFAYGYAALTSITAYLALLFTLLNLGGLFVGHTSWLVDKVSPARYSGLDRWDRIILSSVENWFPSYFPYILLGLLITALGVVFFAIYYLSREPAALRREE